MVGKKGRIPIVAAVLVLLAIAACGPLGGDQTAAASATPSAPAQFPGPCGDGVCDEAEQSNPSLCPQDCEAAGPGGKCGDGICDQLEQADPALCLPDCAAAGEASEEASGEGEAEPQSEPEAEPEAQPEGEPEPEPEGGGESQCEPSEWTIAIAARATLVNAEPSADLFAAIVGGFVVNESCRIRGTSAGQYLKETCAYKSVTGLCSYDIQCPEFTAAISGLAVPGGGITDTFKIRLDRVGIWETGWADCAGVETGIKTGSVLQDAIGSAERNGGGYLAQIVVELPEDDRPIGKRIHDAEQGQDAVAPVNLWYYFFVELYRGTKLVRFEQVWTDSQIEEQPDTWDIRTP
jgi:hypothetical protein